MFEQLQEKNEDSGEEQQNKQQEETQKPPLNKEQDEHSTPATTNKEVKLHKVFLQNCSLTSTNTTTILNKKYLFTIT